jgi:ribosomal protein S18 acetylase RimI-like enzyme
MPISAILAGMPADDDQDCLLNPVSRDHRRDVLAWLAVDPVAAEVELNLDDREVFEARRGDQRVGALSASVLPGRIGTLIGPKLAEKETEELADRLIARGVRHLREHDVQVVQSLLDMEQHAQQQRYARAGFDTAVTLDYLVRPLERIEPDTARTTAAGLELVPYAKVGDQRLQAVLVRTYEGSLDCSVLNGVRDPADILATYRSIGDDAPDNWFLLRHNGRDAGCLLLVDHVTAEQWELVYLGIVPELRGRALGQQATHCAMQRARRAGRRRLTLAVDAANAPAQAMYAASGFLRWDRKLAMLFFF